MFMSDVFNFLGEDALSDGRPQSKWGNGEKNRLCSGDAPFNATS
jgi:hypothetical protein